MSVVAVGVPAHDPIPAVTQSLPLPLPGWGATEARAALDEARAQLPLPLADPVLVSALTTVVFRADGFAVKVYPPGTDPAHLARLTEAVQRSAAVHPAVGAPQLTGHGVVTLTPWLSDPRPVSWPELGVLLRRFHAEHRDGLLPRWTPLSRMPSQVASLHAETALVLLDARAALLAALDEVGTVLGEGTLHGDVNEGNAMRAPGGPRLIDLDWVARGPLEYDLAGAARRFRSGRMDRATYAAFCAGYGYDVTRWAGLSVLDRVAELGGLTFRIWDDRHHGRPLDWLPAEVRRWRVAV
jgi:hypothetical protein